MIEENENIKIDNFVNVQQRATELDCNVPESFAFLPRNFSNANSSEELIYENATTDLKVLFKQAGIDETKLEKEGENFPSINEQFHELILPTLFISGALVSQNPEAVSVALNIVSSYTYDFFKGKFGKKKVKFEIVSEKTAKKEFKRISYEGEPEGLEKLTGIVKAAFKD